MSFGALPGRRTIERRATTYTERQRAPKQIHTPKSANHLDTLSLATDNQTIPSATNTKLKEHK